MPSIDERLQAIAESLELMVHESQQMREDMREMQRKHDELDRRERQGRRAVVIAMQAAMQAYLQSLGDNNGPQ